MNNFGSDYYSGLHADDTEVMHPQSAMQCHEAASRSRMLQFSRLKLIAHYQNIDLGNLFLDSVFESLLLQWKHGKFEGYGSCTYPPGSSASHYRGQFVRDHPHGWGTCMYTDGTKFSGQWQNGVQHGLGHQVSLSCIIENTETLYCSEEATRPYNSSCLKIGHVICYPVYHTFQALATFCCTSRLDLYRCMSIAI